MACVAMVTLTEYSADFCLNIRSQTSTVPSVLVTKNTDGRVGLQHPSVRYEEYFLRTN